MRGKKEKRKDGKRTEDNSTSVGRRNLTGNTGLEIRQRRTQKRIEDQPSVALRKSSVIIYFINVKE